MCFTEKHSVTSEHLWFHTSSLWHLARCRPLTSEPQVYNIQHRGSTGQWLQMTFGPLAFWPGPVIGLRAGNESILRRFQNEMHTAVGVTWGQVLCYYGMSLSHTVSLAHVPFSIGFVSLTSASQPPKRANWIWHIWITHILILWSDLVPMLNKSSILTSQPCGHPL